MSKTFVSGLFKTRAAAEAAVDAIIKRGYTRDDISVLIAAVGTTIAIPGLGLFIAGPIAAALAGAGAGGATGGLIGLLIGTGIPEHHAKVYDTGVRGGGILLGVEAKTSDEIDKLETLLEDIGAEYVRTE